MRDLDAAASFTLEHASLGMRAQAPSELAGLIRDHIEKGGERT
ncbi:MAG: hypothetical protein ACLTKG_02935 [Collinsella intestinalis]